MRVLAAAAMAAACLAGCAATPPAPDAEARLDAFAAAFEGAWDNAAQADESDAPRASRVYEPFAAPGLEGRAFALLRFDDRPPEGTPDRVSLRRLRLSDAGALTVDYLFLREPDRWGDLTEDRASLSGLGEADVRVTPGCSMTWRLTDEGFAGATEPGACVSRAFGPDPVRLEAAHTLTANRFVHESRRFAEDGTPLNAEAPADIFDRVRPR